MADDLQGKRVAFLMANEGVEEIELTKPLEGVEGRSRMSKSQLQRAVAAKS